MGDDREAELAKQVSVPYILKGVQIAQVGDNKSKDIMVSHVYQSMKCVLCEDVQCEVSQGQPTLDK